VHWIFDGCLDSPAPGITRYDGWHSCNQDWLNDATITLEPMKITDGGLDDPRVQVLLQHHFTTARAETGRGSAHALDLSGLKSPDIHFCSAWEGDCVVAIGALKQLSESHGEIKSMHTEQSHRRTGAGSAILQHIIARARQMGLSRLSLETGSWSYFIPARELYKRHGFVECPPFGDYVSDPNSIFLTLELC
jgi:putative acetyltransferase